MLACFTLLGLLQAGVIPIDALPLPNRVGKADAVIIGKVTAIENKTETAGSFPGARKTEYKIAVVAIDQGLVAPKGAKTIRLGFVPLPPGVLVRPQPFQPAVGQEGCFFLRRHHEGNFYTAPAMLDFIDKKSGNSADEIALVKRCAKLLADPDRSLQAKFAEDRFLTAGMLLARYRTRRLPADKQEPIEAEQSKLILQALAGADWTPVKDFRQLSPVLVLNRLPLTDKDGWSPPNRKDAKAYAAYAQKWLRDHAGTYRIQKFVSDMNK